MTSTDGRPTLATIATAAGVSVATVSKVVNARPDVAPATRARIEGLLNEHAYVGRRVDGARPPAVELLLHERLSAYSTKILGGVLDEAVEYGVDVVVTRRQPDPRGSGSAQWAGQLAAAGRRAVIAVVSELGLGELTALARAQVPIVVIDPINLPRTRVISVGSTNFTGGYSATAHLIDLGHRRIAYIGGPDTAACNRARLHGYRGALEAAGADLVDEYVRDGVFEYESGVDEGSALLELDVPPTAIFAANDETALGVLEAARTHGLRVPEDLSVVGFDDTYAAKVASPPLTTVAQPLSRMGAVALRTALRLASGERVDSYHVELATELVVRGSTAPPPAEARPASRPTGRGRTTAPRR